MRDNLGDIFQVNLPGFHPVFLSGPQYGRFVLVEGRHNFRWRTENDPVTKLLRHGLLVEDGEAHARLRAPMNAVLSGKHVKQHIDTFWRSTDAVTHTWQDGQTVDMLAEMRKIALLIFMQALLGVDFSADMQKMWHPILRLLKYISPGLWIMAPKLPRPGYAPAIRAMDEYLLGLIRYRRANPVEGQDLLTTLVDILEMSDDLIRDQLLTMLIAGHDTSTALLAWTLYLLGCNPDAMSRARLEAESALQGAEISSDTDFELPYLEMVIKESLRLFPPIHVSNRRAAEDIYVDEYTIPAGSRVMFSIYLTHRDPQHWRDPDSFQPERFAHGDQTRISAYSYLPFGAGPRTCIGAAFAQVEARVVLARLLSGFDLELIERQVQAYMGATLEPHPGVVMRVRRREAV